MLQRLTPPAIFRILMGDHQRSDPWYLGCNPYPKPLLSLIWNMFEHNELFIVLEEDQYIANELG